MGGRGWISGPKQLNIVGKSQQQQQRGDDPIYLSWQWSCLVLPPVLDSRGQLVYLLDAYRVMSASSA